MTNVFCSTQLPKPWEKHRVTVCLPHLETPDLLDLSVRLWQHQDEYPFVLVVDTGSRNRITLDRLAEVSQIPAVEVAKLGIESDVEHRSDRVSIAMDYAFSRCPTEYLLAAHTDLFPKHRGLIQKLLAMCDAQTPVVGWEMSPRGPGPEGIYSGTLSNDIPGHACTLFHMPTMDRIGAGWTMRRAHHLYGLPRGHTEIAGWPDTEVCLGRLLADHGIRPLFLGRETNSETQETDDWVHARSSTLIYLSQGEFLERQTSAAEVARRRLQEWRREDAAQGISRGSHSLQNGAEVLTRAQGMRHTAPGWPDCHSRRSLPEGGTKALCLHPKFHSQGQLVTREICGICDFHSQPPPQTFRDWPAARERYWRPRSVAVVIPCHNYGRFLAEAIESVLRQTHPASEILVVDDASTDNTADVARQYGDRSVRYLRVEFRHSQQTRRVGLMGTHSDVVCFLDADDRLEAGYLADGLARFDNAHVGVVYSDVEHFGDEVGTSHVPATFDRGLLARRNYLHSGSLVLREALVLSRGLEIETDDRHTLQDWLLWRRLTDQGWQARKQTSRYGYRRHGCSMTAGWRVGGESRPRYFEEAGLAAEPVSLFIPLAGRESLWPGLAAFLERQTWPHAQVQLTLFDTSQNATFSRHVRHWLAECDYPHVQHIQCAVGEPGLADRPRAQAAVEVTAAMTRIYNEMARGVKSDYVWVVEDDIVPPDDACERLLRGFDPDTASVSAAYWSRFANAYVVWEDDQHMLAARGEGLQPVGGNGFGCVVLRGEVLRSTVFTATIDHPAYDNAFYHRLPQTGLKAKVDWSLVCEHRTSKSQGVTA